MMSSGDPKPPSDRAADLASEIKLRQLQQHLHRPGWIAPVVHPFVKQMALSQLTHPKTGQLIRDLSRVMLAGFRLIASLGVISLVKPLELIFGRPIGPPYRDRQLLATQQISIQAGGSLPPLPPENISENITLDTGLDNSK